MISKNTRLNTDKLNIDKLDAGKLNTGKLNTANSKPFLLKPCGKDYLWGGSRLNDEYAKGIPMYPLAETWECSTHPDGISTVAGGNWKGMPLTEVLRKHPEYLGEHPKYFHSYGGNQGELPVLIKLIDARSKLSVQVHPDDDYARRNEKGQPGKTEMRYVLDADRDAQLLYGLYQDTDKETLYRSILDGTVERYLQKVRIRKGEVYYVEAGTIHAIGAGALIAEIQENSDLTYRMYDYGRVDKNGKRRELHIQKALEAANLKGSGRPVQPMRVLRYRNGYASELLCRCKYFEVQRIVMNTERCRQMAYYQSDCMSFRVLLCLGGCGVLLMDEGDTICFFKGDCIFFPAASVRVRLHGKAEFLDVRG